MKIRPVLVLAVLAAALLFGGALAEAQTVCVPSATNLCLNGGRFQVEVTWLDAQGKTSNGKVAPFESDDAGIFWFFEPENWELYVKVANGCSVNQRFWVYAATPTGVRYTLRVTDTVTGKTKTYRGVPGAGAKAVRDQEAFAACAANKDQELTEAASFEAAEAEVRTPVAGMFQSASIQGFAAAGSPTCSTDARTVCLEGGRFQVSVDWRDAKGKKGKATASPLSSERSSLFRLSGPTDEMVVKVLNGCAVNSRFWVFSSSTTTNAYTLRVADTFTGEVRQYANSVGKPAKNLADTSAFATCKAAGAPRIELTSGESIVLTRQGEAAQLQARVLDAQGQLLPNAVVSWSSSAPDVVAVEKKGPLTATVRALREPTGAAKITAAYRGVTADTVVLLAIPDRSAALVPGSLIEELSGSRLVLRSAPVTEAITPGQMLVGDANSGLLARALSVRRENGKVIAEVEPASLAEAFRDLRMEIAGAPVRLQGTLRQDTAAPGEASSGKAAGTAANELQCRVSGGLSGATLAQSKITVDLDLSPEVAIIISSFTVDYFRVGVRGTLVLRAEPSVLEIVSGHSGSVECTLPLGAATIPGPSVYGFTFSFKLATEVGVGAELSVDGGSLRVSGPTSAARGEAFLGIEYNRQASDHWQGLGERTWSGTIGQQGLELGDRTIQLLGEAFVRGNLSLLVDLGRGRFGVNILEVGFAELKGSAYRELSMTAPFDAADRLYKGPQWELGLGLNASLKVELSSGLLDKLLSRLGIGVGFSLGSVDLISLRNVLETSPEIRITADRRRVDIGKNESVLLSATAPSAGTGEVEFLAGRPGEALHEVGQGPFVNAGSARWAPTAAERGSQEVQARVRTDAISLIKPYASTGSVRVDVEGGGAPPPAPADLVVRDLVVSPAIGAAGSGITVSFRIVNQGNGPAGAQTTNLRLGSSSTNVTTSDPLLRSLSIPAIQAGSSFPVAQAVTVPGGLAARTYYVWAIVDVGQTSGQTDTSNDRANVPFVVPQPEPEPEAQADLVVHNLVVSPSSGVAGSSVTVSFLVYNQGTGPSSAQTTNVRLNTSSANVTASDPLLTSLRIPALAPGGSYPVYESVQIPNDRPAGTHYVWVILDVDRTGNQGNEANDRASTPFTVTVAPSRSDLVIQGLSVSPASGTAGSNVTVSFAIYNQGAGTANAQTTSIRLNTSPSSVATSDPLLRSLSIPSISPGGSYFVNEVVTIPGNRPAGTHYVWAIVDVNGTANQSNEANDRASTPFTVTSSTPSQSDLVIQNLSVSPASGTVGSNVTVSFAIYNQGAGTANAQTTNIRLNTSPSSVATSDPLLRSLSIPSISPGGSYFVNEVVTIPGNRPAGTHYVWSIVDVNSTANQSNEANDRASTPFTVTSSTPSQSDLVIQNLSVSPSSGVAGSNVMVAFAIYNQGGGTANAQTTNIRLNTSSSSVSTSDPLLRSLSIPSISPGGSYFVNEVVTIPGNRPTGTHYVWAIVDVNSTANQSNESNDRASIPFTVTGSTPSQSDLVIQNMSVSPSSGAAGSNVTVSFTIYNQGGGTANAQTTNIRLNTSSSSVSTSDPLLRSLSIPSISSGGSYFVNEVVTIPGNRPAGTHYIWAIVDVNSTANQSNESNDRANRSFTVTSSTPSQSDLVIQSMSVSPSSGAAGSNVTVSFTIYNQGAGTANAQTTNIRLNTSSSSVSTSDPLLRSLSIPSISSGGSYFVNEVVTIPGNRPAGTHYVWAIVDVNSTANQSNESNDKANRSFTVTASTAQSDLVIQNLSVSPSSGAEGSSVTVSFTIYNQGAGTANAQTTNIRLNTSSSSVSTSDPLLRSLSIPSISSGGSYFVNETVTIPSNRPTGTHYIWAILDVNSTANQSNESNDKANRSFYVF